MIVDLLIAPLIGALMAVALGMGIELWKVRGRRRLYGEWICAIQPVNYLRPEWHIEKLAARPSLLGIKFETLAEKGKLEWRWSPRLEDEFHLVGPWKSTRKGAVSHGYMSVVISLNGQYMFGHDYGTVGKDEDANYGVLLIGRTQESLQSAWTAMAKGVREMRPLTVVIDFP